MPVAVSRKRIATGNCLLWSMPVAVSRKRAAAGKGSTVVDSVGGVPETDRNRELSTVVDAGGGIPEAGRSRGNVYCGRCQWRYPGSGPQQGKCLLWSMPVAVSRKRIATGNCLLWSMPVVASRKRTATGKGSTVVDAGGGIPEADRNRELSTVVDAGGGIPGADHNRGNVYCGRCRWRYPGSGSQQRIVYCGRCRWRYPGSGPQQGKGLLWSMPVAVPRERAAAGKGSTVVDSIGVVPGAGRSRGNVYCGRCRWWRPGSGPQQGKGLLWSITLVSSRERAAAEEMSTVVDAVGGVPEADRNRERVYCGRCRWWSPGSGPQQGKGLLWSIALVSSRERAAAEEMSTVVDAVGGVPEADRNREMSTVVDVGEAVTGADRNRERVYCGRYRWWRPGRGPLQVKGLLWSMSLVASRKRAVAGERSTVVDVVGGVQEAGRCR